MTKEDLITKIRERCDRETHGWWIFKWKSTFKLTKTEPYFVVQTIEQLPDEYISIQVTKPAVVLTKKGVYIGGNLYGWPTILVTAILHDNARGSYLILGLENGRLIEGFIDRNKLEVIREFGHMVEMYKRNAAKAADSIVER